MNNITNIEIIQWKKRLYKEISPLNFELKEPLKIFCSKCKWIDNGCDTQNTVCMSMAREWSFSLLLKNINHNTYELKT